MKTSKIKEVVTAKPHANGNTYHDLVLENGDKINIGKKKAQQVGWELTYEITDEQSGMYKKAKSVQVNTGFTPQASTQSNSSQSENKSLNVQNMIVAQNSVTNAVNYCKDSMSKSPENVLEVAELFYKWVLNKG